MNEELLEKLKKQPMTLRMILGDDYSNSTKKNICCRKLYRYVKQNEIYKLNIHARIVLYYSPSKEYLMMVKKRKVYYVSDLIKVGLNAMKFKTSYQLKDDKWTKNKDITYLNEVKLVI